MIGTLIKYSVLSLAAASIYMWAAPIARQGGMDAVVNETCMVCRSALTAVVGTAQDMPATVEAQYKMAACLYNDTREDLHDKAIVETGVKPASNSIEDQLQATRKLVEARARLAKREMMRQVGVKPCR